MVSEYGSQAVCEYHSLTGLVKLTYTKSCGVIRVQIWEPCNFLEYCLIDQVVPFYIGSATLPNLWVSLYTFYMLVTYGN